MRNKYAGLMQYDIANAEDGIAVSFWVQGCPLHCKGCQNPQTWNPNDGLDLPKDYLQQIDNMIEERPGTISCFSILGGEPFAEYNLSLTYKVIHHVSTKYPQLKIVCWTGYTYEELRKRKDDYTQKLLIMIDTLIDGPFVESKRDITLKLRGSTNQRILHNNGKGEFYE